MKNDSLVPLKRVLDEIGVSRATLWRALNSGIEGFPKPTIVRRRVFWTTEGLRRLETALDEFRGRCVFDAKRARELQHTGSRHQALALLKQDKRRMKRRLIHPRSPDTAQRDFFEP